MREEVCFSSGWGYGNEGGRKCVLVVGGVWKYIHL